MNSNYIQLNPLIKWNYFLPFESHKALIVTPWKSLCDLEKSSCLKGLEDMDYDEKAIKSFSMRAIPKYLKCDPEIGLLATRLATENYFHIHDSLKDDIDFHKSLYFSSRIYYPGIFTNAPETIRGNRDFICLIIDEYPEIYSSVSEELLSDRELFLKLINENVFPPELPSVFSHEEEIVYKLIDLVSDVQKRGDCWKYVSALLSFISVELLNSRDILNYLFCKILYLKFEIPAHLQGDTELVVNAIKSNSGNFDTLAIAIKESPEILIELFKADHRRFIEYEGLFNFDYEKVLNFVQSLRKFPSEHEVPEFVESSVDFIWIVDKLVSNNFFIREIAVHIASIWNEEIDFYKYFTLLSAETKANTHALLALLQSSVPSNRLFAYEHREELKDYVSTKYVFENYVMTQDNKELFLEAVSIEPSLYQSLPSHFKNDEDLIIAAIRRLFNIEDCEKILCELPSSLRENHSFILKLLIIKQSVEGDGSLIKFSSEHLRDNLEFVKQAIKVYPHVFIHISERLRNSKDLQNLAIKSFQNMREELRRKHSELEGSYYELMHWRFADGKSDEELDVQFKKLIFKNIND